MNTPTFEWRQAEDEMWVRGEVIDGKLRNINSHILLEEGRYRWYVFNYTDARLDRGHADTLEDAKSQADTSRLTKDRLSK